MVFNDIEPRYQMARADDEVPPFPFRNVGFTPVYTRYTCTYVDGTQNTVSPSFGPVMDRPHPIPRTINPSRHLILLALPHAHARRILLITSKAKDEVLRKQRRELLRRLDLSYFFWSKADLECFGHGFDVFDGVDADYRDDVC